EIAAVAQESPVLRPLVALDFAQEEGGGLGHGHGRGESSGVETFRLELAQFLAGGFDAILDSAEEALATAEGGLEVVLMGGVVRHGETSDAPFNKGKALLTRTPGPIPAAIFEWHRSATGSGSFITFYHDSLGNRDGESDFRLRISGRICRKS